MTLPFDSEIKPVELKNYNLFDTNSTIKKQKFFLNLHLDKKAVFCLYNL